MGVISINQAVDGLTAVNAASLNTNFNTIANVINGNLDANNIAPGGVIPSTLVGGAGSSWAWQSWTPTLTNITLGNGTLIAKYLQVGKAVTIYFKLIFGSTTAVTGAPNFTPPVAINTATYPSNGTFSGINILQAGYWDTSAAVVVLGNGYFLAAGTISPSASTIGTTYVTRGALSATIPFTWATGDEMHVTGTYETA